MRPALAVLDWMAASPRRSFAVIFLSCFAIRVSLLSKVPLEYVLPHDRWEMEAVATSLATSGQFANPYALPTGPTAHLPPVPPGILASIWRLFGMGLVAGYAAWIFRISNDSAMYALLPWLAGRLGLRGSAGVLGGLAGVVLGDWPGHGEALTAIVLGLLLVALLGRWTEAGTSPRRSFLLGLAAGAAFHLQPALLPVVLGAVAFELWWSRERRKWSQAAVLALGMLLACVPWAWRNNLVFHEVFFIRSNLGLELRMGNHEGAVAAMEVMDALGEHPHPRTHEEEARKVQQWGEVEYMRRAGREALAWIRSHPTDFLRLTGWRVLHFWFGPLHDPLTASMFTGLTVLALLGMWRSLPAMTVPQRAALLIPLATYPLIYYIVTYMPRYGIPVRWILLLFAGAAVVGGRERGYREG